MQIGANGIRLEVEDHGSPAGEPLVLIMGLGMQLVAWHEDFVHSLVQRGFRVIRFDNRDIGLSQDFDHLGVPNVALEAMKHAVGLPVRSPYSLVDMANDTAALLDALGIPSAHVCGASMGGMVAQQLAVRHPQRVKSLTLMMTTSGARRLPGPSLRVRGALLSRPADPKSFDSIVAHYVQLYKLIGSPAYPSSDQWLWQRLSHSVRRSHRPRGVARQLVAIAADGDRTPLLGRIKAPTQVLHGTADPLVPVAGGRDLAARIAGARLDLVEGMGHDLPVALWPRFADAISAAASRA
ncbi:alpha/beta hydrolase [Piscinibacter sp. XHJ-5]|uniref:alpha/beta fold hydrolase n=1 Tax=Piscinibacter sp. XHJ-5 TaxID=3037797 RepID=UPI0024533D9A|nr:alpha/beta hydrolase [Piscinibacter sp. XHJ-5]